MKPLNIAVLGYNSKLSVEGVKQLIKNNEEQFVVFNVSRGTAVLKDGPRLEAITDPSEQTLRGKSIDQLILFDDDRWEIVWSRAHDIELIQAMTMQRTIVPKKFQILKYEDIGE